MTDPIEAAIEGVIEREQTVTMAEVPLTDSASGRPMIVAVPVDLTELEAAHLAAFVLTQLRPYLAANAPRPSRLFVPQRIRDA